MAYRLTKHHGLGNDFLVLLGAPADLAGIDGAMARRWCDRRRGIGADGLLLGTVGPGPDPDPDLVMTLFNADGSRAEMSGNGIRCLAQAEAMRRGTDQLELRIGTDAGTRTVRVCPASGRANDRGTVMATVDMGRAGAGPEPDIELAQDPSDLGRSEALALSPLASATVDVGNPHLVLLVDDPEAVDLVAAGSLHEASYGKGINVHVIAPTDGEPDALSIRVWERGVGVTDACGTGAVAAAHAAHGWGLVGRDVVVHMPGGDVRVAVGEPMTLTGPATYIAAVEVCA